MRELAGWGPLPGAGARRYLRNSPLKSCCIPSQAIQFSEWIFQLQFILRKTCLMPAISEPPQPTFRQKNLRTAERWTDLWQRFLMILRSARAEKPVGTPSTRNTWNMSLTIKINPDNDTLGTEPLQQLLSKVQFFLCLICSEHFRSSVFADTTVPNSTVSFVTCFCCEQGGNIGSHRGILVDTNCPRSTTG